MELDSKDSADGEDARKDRNTFLMQRKNGRLASFLNWYINLYTMWLKTQEETH